MVRIKCPCKNYFFKILVFVLLRLKAFGKRIIDYCRWVISFNKVFFEFNCVSKNVIYILMCNTCEWFYLGQTTNLKQRIRKHKSDVFHSQNSFGKKCSEHLRDCSRMKEPFFRKPQLNTYQ